MREEKEVLVTIFEPETSRDMRIEFPELAGIEEFKNLSANQMKFVWYVANRTSPLFELPRDKKILKALDIIYPRGYSKFDDLVKISNGEIPDELDKALDKMVMFSPSNRTKAALLTDYAFSQLEKLISYTDDQIRGMDFDDKKKYADLLIKVQNDMPKLVKNNEEMFGVKFKDRKTKGKVLVDIKTLGK